MMNFALAMSFADRTAYAGKMLLIGLGTVFGALAILMVALMIFHRIVEGKGEKGQEKAPVVSAPVTAPAPVAAPAPKTAPAADNGALIAAITAAVAATLAEENGGIVPAFRVVSFRPVKTVSNRK